MRLQRLFDYDGWANRATIASVARAERPPARVAAVAAHIVGAEWLWWARLHHEAARFAVWPTLSVPECDAEAVALAERWHDYVGGLDVPQLAASVTYTNSQGREFTSTVEDILLHVVMHSAYHRGQIASGLRAAGAEPAYTDNIHARRQGLVG